MIEWLFPRYAVFAISCDRSRISDESLCDMSKSRHNDALLSTCHCYAGPRQFIAQPIYRELPLVRKIHIGFFPTSITSVLSGHQEGSAFRMTRKWKEHYDVERDIIKRGELNSSLIPLDVTSHVKCRISGIEYANIPA